MARHFTRASTQDITVDSSTSLMDALGDFTVRCWWRQDTSSLNRAIVGRYGGGGQRSWLCYHPNAATLKFRASSNGGTTWHLDLTSSTTFNTGQWYHVVVSRAGSAAEMWVDNSSEATGTHADALSSSTASCVIGDRDPGGYEYDGDICGLAMWDGAGMAAADVAADYAGGRIQDPTWWRPDALVFYAPFYDNDGDRDWTGRWTMTANNSPTYVADRPREIVRLWGRSHVAAAAAAVSAFADWDTRKRRQNTLLRM